MSGHRASRSIWFGAVLALLPGVIRSGAAGPSPNGTVKMTVHAGMRGPSVSPTLYGVFFEEINHAGEGGLYAELVRNRTFKEVNSDGQPAAWSLRTEGTAHGQMARDDAR